MHRWLPRLALLVVVGAGAVGCVRPSVYTTKNTTMPVMLGPVKTLRAAQPTAPGPVVSVFREEVENFFAVSSSTSQQGNYQVTTTTTSWKREGSAKFDIAMINALQACPQCAARTNVVHVGSYYLYWLCAIMEKNWAAIHASVHGR
ncbi:MAG TPA: hypothetical protein VGQ83_38450 [Polyangia bacterium]